ncbi:MAG: GAF domain-containing protein [Nitrospiraceae bacterium]|nr:MAG: GAF domain-containing protein [Nitrospiraceae bacterium]
MKRILDDCQDTGLLWEVLDGLRLPAFLVNSDFMVTDCNISLKARLDFTKEDTLNRSVFDFINIAPPLQHVLFKKKVTVLEGRCIQKNRESFPAKINFIKHADGFIVVAEDISELIKIEMRAAHRRKEINTYNALSKTLSRATDLKVMTEKVLEPLVNTMNFDAAWIYLTDDSSRELKLCCFKGVPEGTLGTAEALKPYEGFVSRVFSSEKALLVKNVLDDPRVTPPHINESGFNSIAGVPLVVKSLGDEKGKVVGVLGVADRMNDYFSSLDIQFLTTIGNQLGVAIENARLIANLKEKVKQIKLINEISSVVNSSLSIGHIFRLVFSEIRQVLDFDRASITLLKENNNFLEIFAIDTKRPTKLTKGVIAPTKETSAGWVTKNQKPWINRDLKEDMSFHYDSVLLNEGIRSTISVPLFKDRPLGALNLDSIMPGKYSEKDLEILMPVAKHLSIALENAILFEEITREKREWEKTFDAITDMVWIVDLKGKVLRVNRAVIEKSGRAELSLIQKSSHEIFKSLQILDGENLSFESIEHKRQLFKEVHGLNGSIYYFWTYPLLNSEGNIYGVVNYLREVTEQKRLEQRLIRADKLASLGILVAGVAHEINNPLGIIAGYSEALLDRAKDPELHTVEAFEDFPDYLKTINNEIFRCKDTLNTLLDFARPSGGIYREIDINGLIKEVILLVKHGARAHKPRIDLNLQRNIPETMADPGAMRQVFLNIIMNSFYFMGSEGVIIISTAHEKNKNRTDYIRIRITDNGKGIEKEIVDKIFDPFFSTKAVGEGTGLGLSICHRIITEHCGTIDVESKAGAGTTFIIRIPVKGKKLLMSS